jgi:hypothetical protein
MEIPSLGDEIRAAIDELGLSSDKVAELSADEALACRARIEEKFMSPGYDWWWERLKSGVAFWEENAGPGVMAELREVCPDVPAWFLPVYQDHGEVFRARPTTAIAVLNNCRGMEFAIVAEDLSWIVILNHHDVVYGVGEPIASRLMALVARPGARVEKFGS